MPCPPDGRARGGRSAERTGAEAAARGAGSAARKRDTGRDAGVRGQRGLAVAWRGARGAGARSAGARRGVRGRGAECGGAARAAGHRAGADWRIAP
jgi:hypothetical protein